MLYDSLPWVRDVPWNRESCRALPAEDKGISPLHLAGMHSLSWTFGREFGAKDQHDYWRWCFSSRAPHSFAGKTGAIPRSASRVRLNARLDPGFAGVLVHRGRDLGLVGSFFAASCVPELASGKAQAGRYPSP